MSDCTRQRCLNGKCFGCKNGQTWCDDPKCNPNCPNCQIRDDHDYNAGMVIIVILLCLFTILFIVWFVYGPQLFHQHSDHSKINYISKTSN